MHRVAGGLVCTRCLAELERALDERALPARLRQLPAAHLAMVVVVALVVGGAAIMGSLLGPAGWLASTACAGVSLGIGPAGQLGAAAATVGNLPTSTATATVSAPPPPTVLKVDGWMIGPGRLVLGLHGAGYQPNELVCVIGSVSGRGRDGHSRRDAVGPFGITATLAGTWSDRLDFDGAPGGYPGAYRATVQASGIAELRRGERPAGVSVAVTGTSLTVSATPPARK